MGPTKFSDVFLGVEEKIILKLPFIAQKPLQFRFASLLRDAIAFRAWLAESTSENSVRREIIGFGIASDEMISGSLNESLAPSKQNGSGDFPAAVES